MSAFLIRQLHTLDTFTFSYFELNKVWGCDKRYGMDALQRFLFINKRALDYLQVKADIEVHGNDPYLRLQTSKFAGSVPLFSPSNGKPCCDLNIGGRFGEDISELLSMIHDTILPEYNDTLPPLFSSLVEPPLYFECCNFIDKWLQVEKVQWHKFDVIQCIEHIPTSGTRWDLYAMKSFDPSNTFRYPNRSNKINQYHKEFCQLISVLKICINELKKTQVPMRSRLAYMQKITRLNAKYKEAFAETIPSEFYIHAADPVVVKEAKILANVIIKNQSKCKRAWRIDYSEFFERYVQYVFKETFKISNYKVFCNPHYTISGSKPAWALHYLEPDLILQNEGLQIVLDAKYKSHMFNRNEVTDDLKNTFRHDLHQILAYCSFNTMQTKKAMLVYPFEDFTYQKIHLRSTLTHSDADIYLLGIPLAKSKLEELKEGICSLF